MIRTEDAFNECKKSYFQGQIDVLESFIETMNKININFVPKEEIERLVKNIKERI